METQIFTSVALGFEVTGLIAFAASGALLAAAKRMDVIGMMALATVTGLGGGMTRDVLIGATPVAALVSWWMLLVTIGTALLVFLLFRIVHRLRRAMLLFDALGLGIFVVNGTMKAHLMGVNPVGAAVVGLLTGVGGGVIRDLIANDIPVVFQRDSKLYLTPALLGAATIAALAAFDITAWWISALTALGVFAVRLTSEVLGWRAPSIKTQALDIVNGPGDATESR